MKNMRTEAPELLALKLQLSLDTRVDPYALADWIRANEDWLSDSLKNEDVVTPEHPDYYGEIYAWSRLEFKRFMDARKTEQTPPVPAAMTTATQPSTQSESAGSFGFSKLFRRRAP